jgi:hypothetical protein
MNLASAFKSIGNDAKGAAPAAGHAVDDTGKASAPIHLPRIFALPSRGIP